MLLPDRTQREIVPIPGREALQRNFADMGKNGFKMGKDKYSFRTVTIHERFTLMYRGYVLRVVDNGDADRDDKFLANHASIVFTQENNANAKDAGTEDARTDNEDPPVDASAEAATEPIVVNTSSSSYSAEWPALGND
uniref:Polyprotein n=1 Tax=Steinernema glaseri TaxID=37863 RepID=A0A1I7Z1G8_9BILA